MADIAVANPGTGNDILANINTALAAASHYDRLVFPAGSFTLTGEPTTTKKVSLLGQGIGITTIYRSESYADGTLSGKAMFIHNINSDAPCGIKISGITFKSKLPSINNGADGLSIAPDRGLVIINAIDFIVTNCRFENFGDGAVTIYHRDYLARGVIYSNQFEHNYKGANGLDLGYGVVVYGESVRWIPDDGFGTNNFIFVETNTFNRHRHSFASAGCSRSVVRNNTVTNNLIGPADSQYIHCIDAHDARGIGNGTNTWGGRAIEVYNNSLVNAFQYDGTTPVTGSTTGVQVVESCIGIRGGAAVIWGNLVDGYRFAIEVYSSQACDAGANPAATKPWMGQAGYCSQLATGTTDLGTSERPGRGDMWCWSNTFTTHSGAFWSELYLYTSGGSDNWFLVDRDYHVSTGGSSSAAKPNYTPYPYPHPLTLL